MDFTAAHDAVQRDVVMGLTGFLTATDEEGDGFHFQEPFGRWIDGGVKTPSEDTYVVPWVYRGIHHVESVDGNPIPDLMGFLPTRQRVEVKGVTIAYWETDEAEPQFTRFIDWAGALAQIGVGFSKRPVIDDPANAGLA